MLQAHSKVSRNFSAYFGLVIDLFKTVCIRRYTEPQECGIEGLQKQTGKCYSLPPITCGLV